MNEVVVTMIRPGAGFPLFRAVCSCGWSGHRFYSSDIADREAVDHRWAHVEVTVAE